MKRALAVLAVAMFLLPLMVPAQAPQAPQPGPEVKKLDYFVGTWNMEGDSKASPYGPAGKFSGSEHDDWMPGNFFLVAHSAMKVPGAEEKGLAVMGYDTAQNVYTYHSFGSTGMHVFATGVLEGDTWTWHSEDKMGGKVIKGRYIIKQLSPSSYTIKFDMASDTGEWNTIMEGKATKSK